MHKPLNFHNWLYLIMSAYASNVDIANASDQINLLAFPCAFVQPAQSQYVKSLCVASAINPTVDRSLSYQILYLSVQLYTLQSYRLLSLFTIDAMNIHTYEFYTFRSFRPVLFLQIFKWGDLNRMFFCITPTITFALWIRRDFIWYVWFNISMLRHPIAWHCSAIQNIFTML